MIKIPDTSATIPHNVVRETEGTKAVRVLLDLLGSESQDHQDHQDHWDRQDRKVFQARVYQDPKAMLELQDHQDRLDFLDLGFREKRQSIIS
ncbi:uncharacterized [Tachysurus ichikawai]